MRITLTSEDRPYSFAIDAYRILKRAGAGQTIVFDFRADQAGTFTFYCNLTSDPACRDMKGRWWSRRSDTTVTGQFVSSAESRVQELRLL